MSGRCSRRVCLVFVGLMMTAPLARGAVRPQEDMLQRWHEIVKRQRTERTAIASLRMNYTMSEWSGNPLTLAFRQDVTYIGEGKRFYIRLRVLNNVPTNGNISDRTIDGRVSDVEQAYDGSKVTQRNGGLVIQSSDLVGNRLGVATVWDLCELRSLDQIDAMLYRGQLAITDIADDDFSGRKTILVTFENPQSRTRAMALRFDPARGMMPIEGEMYPARAGSILERAHLEAVVDELKSQGNVYYLPVEGRVEFHYRDHTALIRAFTVDKASVKLGQVYADAQFALKPTAGEKLYDADYRAVVPTDAAGDALPASAAPTQSLAPPAMAMPASGTQFARWAASLGVVACGAAAAAWWFRRRKRVR